MWTAVVDGRRVHVIRTRGMFFGETARPTGRGVFVTDAHRTLAEAQERIEAVLRQLVASAAAAPGTANPFASVN